MSRPYGVQRDQVRDRDLADVGEALCLQTGRGVEAGALVLDRDHHGELDHRRLAQVPEQGGDHLVGDRERRDGHRLGVRQHLPLDGREHLGLAPAHDLADLLQVQALAVREVVAEVQAPRAADGRGGRRLREHVEVAVERVELGDLLLVLERRLHDLLVVPQDVGVVGDLAPGAAGVRREDAAVETGDGGLGDAERAGCRHAIQTPARRRSVTSVRRDVARGSSRARPGAPASIRPQRRGRPAR